jgi:O-antigen ligase
VAGLSSLLPDPASERADRWRLVAAVGLGLVLIAGAMREGPVAGPRGLFLVAVAGAAGVVVLLAPLVTTVLLLLASFFRLAVHVGGLPAEPMTLLFAALVAAVGVAALRGTVRLHFGPLEAVMFAYLLWNIVSAMWPHAYPAIVPNTGESIVLYRFILMGTVFPFAAYAVGRAVFRDPSRIRVLVFCVLGFAAYSGLVSILQFTGPRAMVWPRYIVDAPSWPERAVGVFDQPVVNGLVMSIGFVAAVLVAGDRSAAGWQRLCAGLVAPLCLVGVYLTHTRAVWIVFGVGVVVCALVARGQRGVFVATLVSAGAFVVADWATISSADRASGGLGSASEVYDRLNMIRTSLWAIGQEPLFGWGLGRFQQVNTHHHMQWATDVNWMRGYGYSSHENELGIAVELGLIGLALWLVVLGLLAHQVVRAFRRLRDRGVVARTIAVLAVVAPLLWAGTGFTVDLRFNDFVNLLVFLVAGAAVGLSVREPAPQPAGAPT